jgi:hypothetical protein
MQHPPVNIWLAAWATGLAESLERRHGWRVALVVGNMRFPHLCLQGPQSLLTGWHFDEGATPMDTKEMTVSTEHPLTVETGRVLRSNLVVRNLDTQIVRLSFNGPQEFRGIVIDRTSGAYVNGGLRSFDAGQECIEIAPSGKVRVPVVVETSSCDPALGYAVPPGTWDMQVVVLANERRLLTPRLPITVTPGRGQ